MAKTPDEMTAAMIANMKDKTGKTLEQWLAIAAKAGEEKHGKIVANLKSEHGLSHGFANLVAHKALKSDAGGANGGTDFVAAQYAGPKADLRSIYDAIVGHALSLGDDVEIAPKKSYVSLRRSKQFALIQPSTKTRVDLGINLKGARPENRLEASGSFNAMVSRRVRLSAPSDVDADVKRWLRAAYDAASSLSP